MFKVGVLAIKRLENYELIKKIIHTTPAEELGDYVIVVLDRKTVNSLKEVKASEITKLMKDRLVLGDTVIPLHRVVEIRRRGEVLWRRSA
ncbi:MAG: RNA repair domain-containing protein [Desulfurococcaceae archaeon]|nr:RNA repair domain-containing protein [Desulfurococcaceae archaeon]